MSNIPLISVIMPVYQSENFLDLSIVSILNQSIKDFELLIIYDVSSDNSLSIIKKFQAQDKRVIIIKGNGKNLINALNLGISNSKGKYIARMDADDISLPDRFKKQIKHMEKYNLDICGCHCFLINKLNHIKGINLFPLSHEMCSISLAFQVPFAHPSVIMKKNFLKKNNLTYGQSKFSNIEDFDLWIRMYEKGAKFGNVNDILFKYRQHVGSLSKINVKKILDESKKITATFFVNNKKNLQYLLNNKKNSLNKEDQVLLVKLVFKFFFEKFEIFYFKYLRTIKIKIIFYYFISKIKHSILLILNKCLKN